MNSEVLAVCKILLESRAFTKKEMKEILDKLISCCVPEANQRATCPDRAVGRGKESYVEKVP